MKGALANDALVDFDEAIPERDIVAGECALCLDDWFFNVFVVDLKANDFEGAVEF